MRRVGWLGVALLLGTACGTPGVATTTPTQPAASGATTIQVTLTNDACTLSTSTATAGPVTFQVQNTTGDAVSEVELLKGDVIVGEKENLTPGVSGSFSVSLTAGDYQLYCPGATTEKTPLHVVSSTASQATPAVASLEKADLHHASTSYRSYVLQEAGQLVSTTQALAQAVTTNNLDQARELYPQARVHYESIEPVAERFGELDSAIDMREDDAPDPASFTGFHRLEKALWQDNSLTGMPQVTSRLVQDVQQLQQLVNDPTQFDVGAADIANGSTELLDEVAKTKITGEEERYSHVDLLDMSANVDGARPGFQLLQPALQ